MPLGSEALSWLVSCFLTLLIPHFSHQMFSVSWPAAGGGGRTVMALLSWCEGFWCEIGGAKWSLRRLEAGVQEFSNGELCALNIRTQRD